jgi:hypothetical protein
MAFLKSIVNDPIAMLWVALWLPFAARFFVAWSVWIRVRGLWPSRVLSRHLDRSAYRSPNDPIAGGIVLLVAIVVAFPVSILVVPLLGFASAERWFPLSCFVLSLALSLVYVFRRLREDDGLSRRS